MKQSGHSALAALLALALASSSALAQDQAPKRGFFRQLGQSLKEAGQQIVGLKPNASSQATARPLYTPVSGAGKIVGLYQAEDHQAAQMGHLDWPRVALTFKEWGASLPCWTVEARIWTSAAASSTETFQACADAALTVKDDLGEEAELNDSARGKATTDLMVGLRVRPGKPNTGDQRTTGPRPPVEPFNVRASREGVAWQARKVALSVAWVSGFLQESDLKPGPAGILTPFRDTRMWIAGFDAAGNRDR